MNQARIKWKFIISILHSKTKCGLHVVFVFFFSFNDNFFSFNDNLRNYVQLLPRATQHLKRSMHLLINVADSESKCESSFRIGIRIFIKNKKCYATIFRSTLIQRRIESKVKKKKWKHHQVHHTQEGKKKKKKNLLGKENGSIQARQISHFRRAYRTEKEKNSRIS